MANELDELKVELLTKSILRIKFKSNRVFFFSNQIESNLLQFKQINQIKQIKQIQINKFQIQQI